MSDAADVRAIMHRALDGAIGDAERAALDAAIAADPELARDFARLALLHDALERELTAGEVGRRGATALRWRAWARRLSAAAVLLFAVGVLAWIGLRGSPANAGAELARIAASQQSVRRDFVIRSLDADQRRPADRRRADPRAKPKPSIDDAVLHVGAPGSYVLERAGDDGSVTVTGSDGVVAWSVPPRGSVRVSRNPARFRGALPGQQHELPFVHPAEGFDLLARSYDLSLGKLSEIDGRSVRSIVGVRRAGVQRGPKEFRLWYDPATDAVLRMELDRLPQANGGPRSVQMDLVAEFPLDPSYFAHDAHHGRDRTVILED